MNWNSRPGSRRDFWGFFLKNLTCDTQNGVAWKNIFAYVKMSKIQLSFYHPWKINLELETIIKKTVGYQFLMMNQSLQRQWLDITSSIHLKQPRLSRAAHIYTTTSACLRPTSMLQKGLNSLVPHAKHGESNQPKSENFVTRMSPGNDGNSKVPDQRT